MRDVVTIDDLSESEMQSIFSLADEFLASMSVPDRPHALRGKLDTAHGFVLATLFYEASTRTRLSFESAMLRLGGQYLSSADPKTSSASKGETLADTVRVVENYADAIVIRHPSEGAARVAADYAQIPVINAGDGGHEHPTQTLCDLYTLQREKGSLKNLNVMLCGDLKNGRTVHSLVYGLARFGARIIPMPAQGLELPEHVITRLRRDYDCVPAVSDKAAATAAATATDELPIDVVYVTPDRPHQRSLFTDIADADGNLAGVRLPENALAKIDAFYVTRLQKERLASGDATGGYPVMNLQFLKNRKYRDSRVLHPLPRVEELAYDIDSDARAVYFKQAAYGVPVRMALLACMLGLKPGLQAAPREVPHKLFAGLTIRCQNERCVSMLEGESRYLAPAFHVWDDRRRYILRCRYCEHDIIPAFLGSESSREYWPNEIRAAAGASELTYFRDAPAAERNGFAPRRPQL